MKSILCILVTLTIYAYQATTTMADGYSIYEEVQNQHSELPKNLKGSCVFWSGPVKEGPADYVGWLQNNITGETWLFAKVDGVWIYQSEHPITTATPSCYGLV